MIFRAPPTHRASPQRASAVAPAARLIGRALRRLCSSGLILMVLWSGTLHAAWFEDSASSEPERIPRIDEDDDDDGTGFIAVPAVLYSPETSVVFTVAALYYMHAKSRLKRRRASTVGGAFAYTLKNQILTEIRPEFFFNESDYHIFGRYRYAYFPDSFFGLGNDTRKSDEEGFTSHVVRLRSYAERRLVGSLYLGLIQELAYYDIIERESQGQLATRGFQGSEGGYSSGLGAMLTYDSRDSVITARRGGFYRASFTGFDEALGSDYGFTRAELDLRQYVPIWGRHSVALRGLMTIMTGAPPLQQLSLLGGGRISRGYFKGRFRARHRLLMQLEYRAPIWWRFGAVGFLSMGQVATDFEAFSATAFHPSGGVGLRFVIDPVTGANARIDLGFGSDSIGFYIDSGEAF